MSSIMTGQIMPFFSDISDPHHSRRHLSRYETIAEMMASFGYRTAAFCPNAYASRYYGFDTGFHHFEDFLFNSDAYSDLFDKHVKSSGWYTILRNIRNMIRKEEAFKTWNKYFTEVTEWVKSSSEPFFLWIFAMDTHYPYLTPSNSRKWSSVLGQYITNLKCYNYIGDREKEVTKVDTRKIIDVYDDAIRHGDKLLEEIHNTFRGYEPTIIVHGDHGEALGEDGVYGHHVPNLRPENIHVPFVIWSEQFESETVSSPISLKDLKMIIQTLVQNRKPVAEELPNIDKPAVASTYDSKGRRKLVNVINQEGRQALLKITDNSFDFSLESPENLEQVSLKQVFSETEELVVQKKVADQIEEL